MRCFRFCSVSTGLDVGGFKNCYDSSTFFYKVLLFLEELSPDFDEESLSPSKFLSVASTIDILKLISFMSYDSSKL